MYEFTDCMIHIEKIDEEHKKLFQLINEASELANKTDSVLSLALKVIDELKDYANTHFANEEAYMESINDPELPLQKKEHAAFKTKINEFKIDDSSDAAAKESLNELIKYLVRWLYHHILSSDMMIGKLEAKEDEDPFAFTDKYKTGIEMVDEEHKKLFEIIRETNDVINTEFVHDKYDEIMRLLAELKNYTEIHFSDEENLMEEIGYPGLEAQRMAHESFVEKLVTIDLEELDEIDDNQQEYLLHLIDFLLGWLVNHIIGMDKKIADYMAKMHS